MPVTTHTAQHLSNVIRNMVRSVNRDACMTVIKELERDPDSRDAVCALIIEEGNRRWDEHVAFYNSEGRRA